MSLPRLYTLTTAEYEALPIKQRIALYHELVRYWMRADAMSTEQVQKDHDEEREGTTR
jgi:hypothetical protein